ncbi:MAG TPA: cytidylate kinase-like family protein [Syntrophales bacterium]|nr:cytidylate kinase-like family protein [Syntrophales bacterium]HOX94145.1 cytidylate kinase-like family protein [Syntrophales bacterium]HPN25415.1 cytidylate kinase-like family protein [Syntrophales bacterium]HQM29897.1 cytidylate kinase-like family protein [Syntrophales bacterium]
MAILSITYEFGSGAEEIGRAIEKKLGYEYLALGRIRKEASQAGKRWERFGEEYGEAKPNIWERYDWSFMGYMALGQSVILNHAMKDNVVIMARGSGYLLGGIPHVLRVRIVAPLEKRIERVMTRENISWENASLLVKQADYEIASTLRQLYGKKWDDPESYEVRYDTSAQSNDQVIDAIMKLLAAKDNLKTQAAQGELEMRALAAKIKAVILTNPDFLIPTLEVEAAQNGIILRGIARSIREHKAIDAEVNRTRDRVPVTCEIHYRGVKSIKPHRMV